MIESINQTISSIGTIDWLNLLMTGGSSVGLSFLANYLYRHFRNRRLIQKRGKVVLAVKSLSKSKIPEKLKNVGLGVVAVLGTWYVIPRFSIHLDSIPLDSFEAFSQFFFGSLLFFLVYDLWKNYNSITFFECGFVVHRRFFYFENIESIEVGESTTSLRVKWISEIEISNHEMRVILEGVKDPLFNIRFINTIIPQGDEKENAIEVENVEACT